VYSSAPVVSVLFAPLSQHLIALQVSYHWTALSSPSLFRITITVAHLAQLKLTFLQLLRSHYPVTSHPAPLPALPIQTTFQSLPRDSIIAPPLHNISCRRHLDGPHNGLSAQRITTQKSQSQQQIKSTKTKPSQQQQKWPASATQLSGNASPSPYTWTRSNRARNKGEALIMEPKTRAFSLSLSMNVSISSEPPN
jgi:hypothetical protein